MSYFFSRLSYSIGNEDWSTEERALNIQSTDEVLCITASGDRPLNLCMRPCARLVCVDANPIQNHLLKLKIASMKTLDFPEYLAFLGAVSSKNRIQIFEKVIPQLDKQAADFWLKNKKMIQKGILYQGEVERLTKYVAFTASLINGRKIKRLFSINELQEQKIFIRDHWNSRLWRTIFKVVLNPFFSKFIIKDPGLVNVGHTIHPGIYIYDRVNASLHRNLAKKNPLLSLLLRGYVSPEAFSPYMTEEGTSTIKRHAQSIEIHTREILEYMESLDGPTFNAFSLSDVASYLSYSDFVRLLRGIIKTAKPGARFCLREFLSSHPIPSELQPYFKRDKGLEKDLEEQDNCFVYRFMVGTVHTP